MAHYRWAKYAIAAMVTAVLGAWLGGCASPGYYLQAARGQMDLLNRGVPMAQLIDDPATDATLRERLVTTAAMREFASAELGLPDNDSYREYSDLERPYVLWNVFATDEFSVDAKTWCFVLVGCVGYRGYFTEAAAEKLAAKLRAKGMDTFVGGVSAYSTLGRFDDPVLNTMLHADELQIASVIFHELAHQVVYRSGDAPYSESFASFVEQEGVRRWVTARADPQDYDRYSVALDRERQFNGLVAGARVDLERLYASGLSEAEMREAKAKRFARLRESYEELKSTWDGYTGYDRWFAQDLNNAHLVSIATYNDLVPAFRALLAENDQDLAQFYEKAAALAEMSDDEVAREIDRLTESDAN